MKNPKISVIICSIEAIKYARICENYKCLFADVPYEIIGIHDARSLAEGYNRGITQSSGDILIFSHDDILILDENFAEKIIDRLSRFDLLGFAGASKIISGQWIDVANRYLHGVIAHALPKSKSLDLNVFGAQEWPTIPGIKVIDGLLMVATRQVAADIRFDASIFDGFHLYDLDFSFSAYLAGFKLGICCDIPLIHESGGNFDRKQREYAQRFVSKYATHLDPPECSRPSTVSLSHASSCEDTEALLYLWNKDTLKRISTTILSTAAFQQNPPEHAIRTSNLLQPIESTPENFLHVPPANSAALAAESLGAFSQIARPNQISTDWGASSTTSLISQKYQYWLSQRELIETDITFLESSIPDHISPLNEQKFHFFIRLPAGLESKLADTLDSLGLQVNENWHLDVVSTLPGPAGLEDVPNVGWQTIPCSDDFKHAVDRLAEVSPCNWIIEIPAGAKLDILYLWRLAKEASLFPEAAALFVDDDCIDGAGNRHTPRFKPGTNPAHLQGMDLAGPLCVRKEAWIKSGGCGVYGGSPWFSQLLRLAAAFGWPSIKHIPDQLITYPDSFPSDTNACLLTLIEHQKNQGLAAELVHATAQSWNTRGLFDQPPPVTIAILSQGQLELLSRCFESIEKITRYPEFTIQIVTDEGENDPDLDQWIKDAEAQSKFCKVRRVNNKSTPNHAARCNAAIAAAENDLVLLVREEIVIVQDNWLEELVHTFIQADIAAAFPQHHNPGDAKVLATDNTLGLKNTNESTICGIAKLGESGYLDSLKLAQDASSLPSTCFLIRKKDYLDAGGMDETALGDHLADCDLGLKLRQRNLRLIRQPRASIVYGGETSAYDTMLRLTSAIAKIDANKSFRQRWGKVGMVDLYWNPNLSLADAAPTLETEYRPQWQYVPADTPRILAHPIYNAQGDFRIRSPLRAARKAGLATECVWPQKLGVKPRYHTQAEIARLAPSTVIVQNYIHNMALESLDEWRSAPTCPFVVYALDDLISDMDKNNPFRENIPPNARARLKYALARCDRLVVSTEFLAETYRHLIPDIRVVPNRLEQDIWRPLDSLKRTGKKPRVGWAGGSTHQGDLMLLKEIIEQTRDEADWIFFGMCPDEIRPLLAEYHDLVPFSEYPKFLALLNLDIAVAPLAQIPFNQGKSNLRLLEYGSLGLPVVCTDIDPYRNSPACRVVNTSQAWIDALRARIHDAEAREREGKVMRDWVHANYLLENHVEDWLHAHLPAPQEKNA
ncbi:glycosyltransferase [Dechloromonas sp. HYN0024]|uniref:glycosyltransferase n=1 Tax=Dechloromonas sp. HYN0024 TaxID=2231055 RepID=UPI000E42E869|nr:glycosyltransferase [Dechloromonas sp. HYN0024]AXS79202.1 glycosyltransferase [Dechloromonas sp. HYN0024]